MLCQFEIIYPQFGICGRVRQIDEFPGLIEAFGNVQLYRHGSVKRGITDFTLVARVLEAWNSEVEP